VPAFVHEKPHPVEQINAGKNDKKDRPVAYQVKKGGQEKQVNGVGKQHKPEFPRLPVNTLYGNFRHGSLRICLLEE
jgi:hypothetical protein